MPLSTPLASVPIKSEHNAYPQGPLATASRLLPRLLDFLTPSSIFSHLPVRVPFFSRTSTPRISKRRRERVGRLKELVDEAEGKGCQAVWAFKGRLGMVSAPYSVSPSHSSPREWHRK